MVAGITPGSQVVMVGAGFIAFTILNSILRPRGQAHRSWRWPRASCRAWSTTPARASCERWLEEHGVAVRTGATVTKIEQVGRQAEALLQDGRAADRATS